MGSDSIRTSRSLLSRLRNWGDQTSWQEFYHTYSRLVRQSARQAGLTDSEAQEVVQEVMILAAKKLPDFRYDPAVGSFRNWLLHSTRWRIADQFRRRPGAAQLDGGAGRDEPRNDPIERIPDPVSFRLESVWEKEWKECLLQTAMERVKSQVRPAHLQAFDLYVVRNWPAPQVARALGINIGQVYLAKHRVSRLLKKEIEQLKKKLL